MKLVSARISASLLIRSVQTNRKTRPTRFGSGASKRQLYCFSRRSIVEPLDNKKWQPTIRRIDLFGKKARHRIANRPISPLGTFLPTFSTRFYMRGVRGWSAGFSFDLFRKSHSRKLALYYWVAVLAVATGCKITEYRLERQDRKKGISKSWAIDVNDFSRKAGATFACESPQMSIGINRLMV